MFTVDSSNGKIFVRALGTNDKISVLRICIPQSKWSFEIICFMLVLPDMSMCIFVLANHCCFSHTLAYIVKAFIQQWIHRHLNKQSYTVIYKFSLLQGWNLHHQLLHNRWISFWISFSSMLFLWSGQRWEKNFHKFLVQHEADKCLYLWSLWEYWNELNFFKLLVTVLHSLSCSHLPLLCNKFTNFIFFKFHKYFTHCI